MKKIFSVFFGMMVLLGLAATDSSAQEAPTAARVINGGVVNGKATSLPKPEYPAGLREAGIGGTVVVVIVIDENGTVISAEAQLKDSRVTTSVDGEVREPVEVDPQLRVAAETAALAAKFSPTLLSGIPVRVKGTLVYNFVPGGDASATQSLIKAPTGGILNGKATSMPLPEYPAAAKAVAAQGAVSVQILIDEAGNVAEAKAVSGHPLLRSAAEAAARQATFSPTTMSGQPVKVSGILVFNFVM